MQRIFDLLAGEFRGQILQQVYRLAWVEAIVATIAPNQHVRAALLCLAVDERGLASMAAELPALRRVRVDVHYQRALRYAHPLSILAEQHARLLLQERTSLCKPVCSGGSELLAQRAG